MCTVVPYSFIIHASASLYSHGWSLALPFNQTITMSLLCTPQNKCIPKHLYIIVVVSEIKCNFHWKFIAD